MNANTGDKQDIVETSAALVTLGYIISLRSTNKPTARARLHYLFLAANQLAYGKFNTLMFV